MHRLMLIIVMLTLCAAPALAQDEIGAAVPTWSGAPAPVSATSWEIASAGETEVLGIRLREVSAFGTLLGPERLTFGAGIDAGPTDGDLRGGVGWIEDRWGIYLRMRF